MVIVNFLVELIEMASSLNEDVNNGSVGLSHNESTWKEKDAVTTKELQKIIKTAMKKVTNKTIIKNFI